MVSAFAGVENIIDQKDVFGREIELIEPFQGQFPSFSAAAAIALCPDHIRSSKGF